MKRTAALAHGILDLLNPVKAGFTRNISKVPPADRLIWLSAMFLMALGSVMVLSSSVMLAERKFGSPGFFWTRQLIWWGMATTLLLTVSRIDHRVFKKYAPHLLLIGLGLITLARLLPPIKDVHRWIDLGPFRLQPAEVFRLTLIIYAAAFLAKRGEEIVEWKKWMPLLIILGVGSVILISLPEFSAALTLWSTTGLLLIAAGVRWRHILPAAGVAVIAAVIVVYGIGYKKARLDEWQNGLTITEGSYQVRQSKIALGSGGLLGQGLGEGRAKMSYLPEPHTDFIISSIGEELGFVGVTLVWGALGLLVFRGWRAAMRAPDRFGYLLCIGIAGSLFVNASLNTMVATGLSPVTGLPLPLVSYGGSSLLCTAAGWGMVLNVSRFRLPQS